jgi:TolA-binding protein
MTEIKSTLKFSKKHKIKEDRFVEKVFEWRLWTEEHLKQIGTGFTVFVVIIFVGFLIFRSQQSKLVRAQDIFGNALYAISISDTAQGISDLEQVIKKYGRTPYAAIGSYMRGRLYDGKKEYDLSQNYFENYKLYKKSSPFLKGVSLRGAGNCHVQRKEYAAAITLYKQFVKECPKHYLMPEILMSLSECMIKENDIGEAKKTLNILITGYAESPQSMQARNLLATL